MAASTLPDADSVTASSADHSSRNSGQSNSSSPKSSSRRSGGRTVSSPWNQIVRGELDTATAVSSSVSSTTVVEPVTFTSSSSATSEEPVGECYDGGNGSSANAGKKPVWNKLANGTEAGPVMGAVSWPALSESAKGTPKSSSDSIKSLGDGSAGVQGTGTSSSSSNKEGNNDVSPNPDSTLTHPITSRQKSLRRNGSNSSYNSALSQQSAPSSPVIDPAPNSSSRDQTQRTAFISSQSHNDHGHQQPRSSFRSRGGGSHPRGDNSHHHNYSSRRDHDRGNQDWNSNRNFNAQPHRVVHRFIRPPPPPPPNTTGFISSPTMRPIGGPLPFPDFVPPVVYIGPPPPPPPPPEALRGVPFVAPIPPNAMFFHGPDPQLYAMIVSQIEYYFSGENLVKDTFLRQKMDEDGWVPVRLIATFSKVKRLTENIQTILDALQSSTLVEVKGDKVRRRNDYDRWIIRPGQVPNIAAPLSPVSSNQDMLAAGVQGIALENINHRDSEGGQGDVHVEAQPCGDDRPGQVNTKAGPDCSSSERS
ncbi:la-related protein 1C-like isoform X2 [Cucurbita moschata]|uniref:La-related protein 1C-like isoform X2 n=1 Tax=Cucurbita moschata TaxID=3662 RepID=A0A6J1GDH3_CUCMO|nr:la-related protein 1C-like isoform X2 [Cucurbita moschata]